MTGEPTITAEAAERVVAGCCLRGIEEVDDARGQVRADDFASWPCRLVFEAAGRLRDAGRRIDAASVLIELSAAGKAADLGPAPAVFLADLLEQAPTAAGLPYAAARVRDAAARRELIRLGSALLSDAADPSETADEIAARYERALTAAADRRAGADEPVSLSAVMADAITRYDDAAKGRRSSPAFATGIRRLDQLIGGLAPGTLTVVAARTGIGKTSLVLRLAEGAARNGHGVQVHSLEMSAGENGDRIVAGAARVSLPRLRGDTPMTTEQYQRVAALFERGGLTELPIHFVDRSRQTAAYITAAVRRAVRKKGVRIVIVDYVQLVHPENPRDPRHQQVGLVSQRLKELARTANVAVVAVAQLNREIEARGGSGKPKLSDIRDSGQIEQDADCVLMLHKIEEDETAAVHKVDLCVLKNRHGPTGTVALDFHLAYARYEERVSLL